MSMLDSFFSKGFKAANCKTLLKLTIPRIKLLRNRREIQIKQMRREIAKLLESGQEATARIRVEHIIREEKMMAAQEIIELFSELITVRLPIIDAQRECPLDLKEAISSVCFAAPRCADLPELLQVQMSFASKYGKEFVSAATELRPECGVNRQLIELLSVRAPAPDVKLKLLKEIAEEHELEWDPTASEAELIKPHEDLLNGPTQFASGSKLPLPQEKDNKSVSPASEKVPSEQSDSDEGLEKLDFPEVPKAPLRPSAGTVSVPEMLPFPASALSEEDHESEKPATGNKGLEHESHLEPEEVLHKKSVTKEVESPNKSVSAFEDKQFLPFISPPSFSSASLSPKPSTPPPPSRTKSEANVDLHDVLAAAQVAAETAERAAAAARAAASLAQVRITELVKKKNDEVSADSGENPFHVDNYQVGTSGKAHLNHQNSLGQNKNSLGDSDSIPDLPSSYRDHHSQFRPQMSNIPSYDEKVETNLSPSNNQLVGHDSTHHSPQPQRLPSMDDETYFSYPNLFTSQGLNLGSGSHSFEDNSQSTP